jgi:NitT/TauT family transport system substrate-binding protein
VAKRYAAAWGKAVMAVRNDLTTRQVLTSHLNTPAELAAVMPLQRFTLASEMTPQMLADLQKFIDLAVAQGVVRERITTAQLLRAP